MTNPSDTFANAQTTALLAQMAQSGSAATQAFQQGQDALAQQRQQALSSAIGPSSGAGGVNDVGALLQRRQGALQDSQTNRMADMGQRSAAYSSDLGLAEQGNLSRRSNIDQSIADKRAALDKEIAGKQADMTNQLAIMKMKNDYAEQSGGGLLQQAKLAKAAAYLQDPYGLERATSLYDARAGAASDRKDSVLAQAANITAGDKNPTDLLNDVRRHPDYGKGVAAARQAATLGASPDVLGKSLDALQVNPVARDLILAEYNDAQRRNVDRPLGPGATP